MMFLLQADQVLFEDPFKIVNAFESASMNNFITYDDSKDQKRGLPCFGFLFIRPSPDSIAVWAKLIKKMESKPVNEQILMQVIMQKERSVTFRFLPPYQFRNGVLFGGNSGKFIKPAKRQNLSGLVFVHVNWVVGVESKIQMLKYHGWWSK